GAVLPEHPAPASPSAPRPVFSSEASGPTALFLAATAYNITAGMRTAAPQLMRSINGCNKVATNTDGSIDLYFGPQKPANVADSNWIQTADGRDFLVSLPLYGARVEFYDQSWKPDDVVKVKEPLFPTAPLRYASAA